MKIRFAKKMLFLLLAFALVSASVSVVTADGGTSAQAYMDYGSNNVCVEYSSDIPYITDVMFYLVGESEDFVSLSASLRAGTARVIPGEAAECTIPAGDDIADGRYRIYAIPGGYASAEYAVYSPSFRIMPSADRTAALDAVNAAVKADIAAKAYETLGEAFDFADDSAWKSDYIYAMKNDDYNGSFTNISQVNDAWLTADALREVNNSSEDELPEVIGIYAGILGADIEDENYTSYTDEAIRVLYKMISGDGIYSASDFVAAFSESCVVAAVNECEPEQLGDIFTKYSKELGIEDYMERYEDVSSSAFARQFDGFTADTAAEVKTGFVSVLKKLEESDSGSSSGSSGGGGGGSKGSVGGGGGNISIAPAATTDTAPAVKSFSDLGSDHWAYTYIMALNEMEIINGYEDNSFRPEALIAREEFAKIIVTAFDLKAAEGGAKEFDDIPRDFWAYDCINTASSLGIVNGVGGGSFGRGQNISRQDAAVMLCRTIASKELDILPEGASGSFTDSASIAGYAAESVGKLSGAGIINGFSDGSFAPEGSLTRAQAAKIIYAILTAH